MPESNDLPSSLVTVCATAVVFFQVTVVPALMVNVAGLKANEPLLSVMIMTVWALPDCVAVVVGVLVVPVVGVGGVVAVAAVVGVVPELVAVVSPPQAARSTSALRATKENKTALRYFFIGVIPYVKFISIENSYYRYEPRLLA